MVQEARDTTTIAGLVAAGVGSAVVPDDTRRIALDGVVYHAITDRDAVSTLHLAWRKANKEPHTRELLQRLLDARAPERGSTRRGTRARALR